jgi:hypothetical protein
MLGHGDAIARRDGHLDLPGRQRRRTHAGPLGGERLAIRGRNSLVMPVSHRTLPLVAHLPEEWFSLSSGERQRCSTGVCLRLDSMLPTNRMVLMCHDAARGSIGRPRVNGSANDLNVVRVIAFK